MLCCLDHCRLGVFLDGTRQEREMSASRRVGYRIGLPSIVAHPSCLLRCIFHIGMLLRQASYQTGPMKMLSRLIRLRVSDTHGHYGTMPSLIELHQRPLSITSPRVHLLFGSHPRQRMGWCCRSLSLRTGNMRRFMIQSNAMGQIIITLFPWQPTRIASSRVLKIWFCSTPLFHCLVAVRNLLSPLYRPVRCSGCRTCYLCPVSRNTD